MRRVSQKPLSRRERGFCDTLMSIGEPNDEYEPQRHEGRKG